MSLNSVDLAIKAAEVAINEKALDVRALNLSEISDIANCFVIASGTSDRHCKNIADKIQRGLKDIGEKPVTTSLTKKDANESSEWIVLDYGHVLVHVFYEPTRKYYDLDELWKQAKPIEFNEELEKYASKLRTGIYSS